MSNAQRDTLTLFLKNEPEQLISSHRTTVTFWPERIYTNCQLHTQETTRGGTRFKLVSYLITFTMKRISSLP